MDKFLETFQKIDPNFRFDILGMGYGIPDQEGNFIRIKPFWVSRKELVENEDKIFSRRKK